MTVDAIEPLGGRRSLSDISEPLVEDTPMTRALTGKVALVTVAAKGI